ncbi:MAG: methyltransferase domain-containing protein [Candidatus Aenigmarchaeota archaeon]|nr:methyltransferase domain-containing protein [Candidatus Aenigmarchaeota archaeon]
MKPHPATLLWKTLEDLVEDRNLGKDPHALEINVRNYYTPALLIDFFSGNEIGEQYKGGKYIGITENKEFAKGLKKRYHSNGLKNFKFLLIDPKKIDKKLKDEFDVIFTRNPLIETKYLKDPIRDWKTIMEKTNNVLKYEGLFIATNPTGEGHEIFKGIVEDQFFLKIERDIKNEHVDETMYVKGTYNGKEIKTVEDQYVLLARKIA